MSRKSETIKRHNDRFRTTFQGGQVMFTSGVIALGALAQNEIVRIVQLYSRFTTDNDPYGEHDLGTFKYAGHSIMWKIDYYDKNLEYGSEDPADPTKTSRVLTIMLAEER